MVKLLAVCALASALGACTQAALPVPTDTDVTRAASMWPDVSLRALEDGRRLYLGRCGSCHRPYHPADHTADEWSREIAEMRVRARLDDRETELVRGYLATFAKSGTSDHR